MEENDVGEITLQQVCNIIILVSAVIGAITTIYKFLKKPVDDIQELANKKEEKHIEEVINARVPALLKKHSDEVRDERKSERDQMVEDIKLGVLEAIDSKIEELKEMTQMQQDQLEYLQKSIDLLNFSQMDLMRYNMNSLYYKYRPFHKILDIDKKAFMKFYKDYHAMGGNTWIDELYKEIITWPIVENEDELKT